MKPIAGHCWSSWHRILEHIRSSMGWISKSSMSSIPCLSTMGPFYYSDVKLQQQHPDPLYCSYQWATSWVLRHVGLLLDNLNEREKRKYIPPLMRIIVQAVPCTMRGHKPTQQGPAHRRRITSTTMHNLGSLRFNYQGTWTPRSTLYYINPGYWLGSS